MLKEVFYEDKNIQSWICSERDSNFFAVTALQYFFAVTALQCAVTAFFCRDGPFLYTRKEALIAVKTIRL